MTKRPPKIELTFGKNDLDIYQWILEKDFSNATFVKRMLREKMNEENGLTIARNVPGAIVSSSAMIEPETQPEESEAPSFGFMGKMSGGRDF